MLLSFSVNSYSNFFNVAVEDIASEIRSGVIANIRNLERVNLK